MPRQASTRDVATCARCRSSKRKCDHARPACARCEQQQQQCRYLDDGPYRLSSSSSSSSSLSGTPQSGTASSSASTPAEVSLPGRVVKRRNRARLSCKRCSRLKVKCDRTQPCERCSRTGFADECAYSHVVRSQGPEESPGTMVLADEDPEFIVASWFLRKRSSGFHSALIDGMEALAGRAGSKTPFNIAIDDTAAGDCKSDFALSGNSPLGSPESAAYASLDKIQSLLREHQADSPSFIDAYFRLYHPTLPVLDEPTFRAQVSSYVAQPLHVDGAWFALYLVVLGIGAYASGRSQTVSARFLYASEACLVKTPYLYRPTQETVATLCLMARGKRAAHATCWVLDASWCVVGLAVHLAMLLVLHREWMPEYADPALSKERTLRRRLWTALSFEYLQLSLQTGQPCLLPFPNAGDEKISLSTTTYTSPFNATWDADLPVLLPYLAHLSSPTPRFSHAEAQSHARTLRSHMHTLLSRHPRSSPLYMELELFFRHLMCVLYAPHAVSWGLACPDAYWNALECGVGVLGWCREVFGGGGDGWGDRAGRPYMPVFFSAAFLVCFLLLSADAGDAASAASAAAAAAEQTEEIVHIPPVPARHTIVETLRACLEIFGQEDSVDAGGEVEGVGTSLCFRTGYRQLRAVIDCFAGEI